MTSSTSRFSRLKSPGCFALVSFAALVGFADEASAASGLQPPSDGAPWAAQTLWPHWQARISLQTGTVSPLAVSGLNDPSSAQRGVQGAALLGDYYFARPAFGGFRASGGLLVGAQGGAPLASAAFGSRWGWSVSGSGLQLPAAATDAPGTATYLGLGYTGAATRGGISLSADLGVMAERPGAAFGAARTMLGNSGSDSSLRDMRLSPLLQLGVRYTF